MLLYQGTEQGGYFYTEDGYMDVNRMLPANPEVPPPETVAGMIQADLRKTCSKFGIALSFTQRGTGATKMISNDVLRNRLNALRTGHLKAFFLNSKHPERGGGVPDSDAHQEPEAAPDVPAPATPVPVPELPKVEPEAVKLPPLESKIPAQTRNEEDEFAAMLAKKLKGGGVDEKRVRDIALAEATKVIGATSQTFTGQVRSALEEFKNQFAMYEAGITRAIAEAVAALPARRIEVKLPDREATAVEDTHQQFPQVMDMVLSGDPVFMVGNAGTGKTTIARNVAQALKLPFHYLTCTIETSRGDLVGRNNLKTGEWEDGPLTICGEQGGVFLLDEISAADGNTLMNFNTLIEIDEWYIPRRTHCPRFKRHKDCYFIAADNTFGTGATRMFSSRNQMDAATLDRFRSGMIEIDYDHKLEERLCDPLILAWGRKVREAIMKYDIRKIMSTRALIALSKKARMKRPDGKPVFTLAQLQAIYYSDWSKDDRKKVAA